MLLSLRTKTAARAFLALTAALCLVSVAPPPAAAAPAAPRTVEVPAGVTAGVAVFDRQTGTFTEQLNTTQQFRAASVVKLLIALDHLWNRSPYDLTTTDRARLDVMLRSSDDDEATHYWVQNGQGTIVDRMVSRLGLTHTAAPTGTLSGYWGYTAITAADTVRIYRHLLDAAPAPVRDYVMGNLRQATRCAADDFNQHFGIAGAFNRPWAVKQGWSGFKSGGCAPTASATGTSAITADASRTEAVNNVDLVREALHTTGTVGTGDRSIVAVLTLHPDGTPYGKAYTDLGRLTRSLHVPGGVRPTGTWFGTWGSGPRVRPLPSTEPEELTTLPAGVEVLVGCQKRGEQVSIPPYTNDWWAYLPQYGGYITNIYISSPGNQLPNVPIC
ncbi:MULTISPECIES: hypothetical protein [Streptomyces]|uniref:Uncharacterized protein n=1 Tax=Streptomyces sudanensis TaxID=436397 RepID=A0ABY4TFI7_9ACTN|nr:MULTISPECIES: hypothetical protein [Streptomyces]URN17512.1 hypothetical protein MW084_18010 [Streptomyces sudanensis]